MMAGCRRNVELPALVFLLNIVLKANLISKKRRGPFTGVLRRGPSIKL